MRTRTKILGLAMAAVLLVCATIFGTMAYLTSTDKVTNTFSVGSVSLTLDEAKVDNNGQAIEGDGAERVEANSYKLLPGKEYDKDPTVHVGSGSEAAWLFVKVENDIAEIEAKEEGYTSIADQIAKNGWTILGDEAGVYWKAYTPADPEVLDYKVFESFKISGDVIGGNAPTAPAAGTAEDDALYLGDYSEATIVVTAYAVQAEGFDTAAAAWAATFGNTTD